MAWRQRQYLQRSTIFLQFHRHHALNPVRRLSTPAIVPVDIASLLALDLNTVDLRRVQVTANVRTVRNQKRRSFVELEDGSTVRPIQALLVPEQAKGLSLGSSVSISGEWKRCPPGKEQSHELIAEQVKIIGATDGQTYPIQKQYTSPEHLRDFPHLRLRTPFNALLARLRSDLDFYLATFFRSHKFIKVHTPIITSSDCEGAGETFTIESFKTEKPPAGSQISSPSPKDEFFKTPKYLTVSSQLHLEAFIHQHPRIWTLSPTFRAEKSDTPRHLSEFYMLEAEMRTESLSEVMDVVENLIRSLVKSVRGSQVGQELLNDGHILQHIPDREFASRTEELHNRWQGLERKLWPRISYHDAIRFLQNAGEEEEIKFEQTPSWTSGLRLEHEKCLAAAVGQGSPVFVTHYPKLQKPFYMLPSHIDQLDAAKSAATVACFDLLLPYSCEVVGGSLREHRLAPLMENMPTQAPLAVPSEGEKSQNPGPTSPSDKKGNLDWYLDLRRYGSVPHGGFGLGFDRLIGYLAGISNVRDVVPWPRYHGKCEG